MNDSYITHDQVFQFVYSHLMVQTFLIKKKKKKKLAPLYPFKPISRQLFLTRLISNFFSEREGRTSWREHLDMNWRVALSRKRCADFVLFYGKISRSGLRALRVVNDVFSSFPLQERRALMFIVRRIRIRRTILVRRNMESFDGHIDTDFSSLCWCFSDSDFIVYHATFFHRVSIVGLLYTVSNQTDTFQPL